LTEKIKLFLVYAISMVFIFLNIMLILKDFYWLLLLPLVIVIALLYIFSMDKVLLLITFLTPISIYSVHSEFNLGLSLPAEPLMFGVLVIFLFKILGGFEFDKRILRHPLSIVIMINLIWIFITTLTSEIPLVSAKFLIARLWFVVPFFFVASLLFKEFSNTKKFIWLYVISLLIVVVYTITRHANYGFDEQAGNWVMKPFYNDHTAYGSALAMFIPFIISFAFNKSYSFAMRVTSFLVFIALFAGLFFSYSRAAWISMAAAIIVWFIILLKIKFKYILVGIIILVSGLLTFQHQILEVLERNRQDSSADFVEHVQSMYNITSDASNLERINRWQAGIRMFQDRPVFGWGPGTYQFVYAPFQRSREKTVISTNLGDLGNAHSEYIGPLSEQGLPGLISVILIVAVAFYTALKVMRKSRNREVRMLSLAALLGLTTYFTHGFLNNFLNTDNASVAVWGFMAMILALDVYHTNRESEAPEEVAEGR
jgi:putative inorganic carbon (hco3(-)) transporter